MQEGQCRVDVGRYRGHVGSIFWRKNRKKKKQNKIKVIDCRGAGGMAK